MNKFLPDTNIIQAKDFSFEKLYKPLCFSAVVYNELMTACNDQKELKQYQQAWKDAVADETLIVPTVGDWLEAGRIQFLLSQERKQDAGGKSPKRSTKVKQELALDCLIALSACRENITIITNDGDYWAIQRYLKKLKLVKFKSENDE